MINRPIEVGEPAPWFSAIADNNPDPFLFDELAGRSVVLFFYGTPTRPDIVEVLDRIECLNDRFDKENAMFLGINNDPACNPVRKALAGRRYIWDPDSKLTRLYGITNQSTSAIAFVTNQVLRITHKISLGEPAEFINQLTSALNRLSTDLSSKSNAPIIVLPQVFDSTFCRKLIEVYDSTGGSETGFAAKIDGRVVNQIDHRIKRRFDYSITDEELRLHIKDILERRLLPMVYRAFQFRTTSFERYIVGCYDAAFGGYFLPHRDNTAKHTSHRRFALTINLNEDYEGGDLRFPEFGSQTYRPPPGGAIIFSCSLLHEVTPITFGRRYAFLSFLCDEAKPLGLRGIPSAQHSTLAGKLRLPPGVSVAIRIAHDAAFNDCSSYADELGACLIEASGWNVRRSAVMNPAPKPPIGLGVLVSDPANLTPTEKTLIQALTEAEIVHDVLPNGWRDVALGLLVTRPMTNE